MSNFLSSVSVTPKGAYRLDLGTASPCTRYRNPGWANRQTRVFSIQLYISRRTVPVF